jgi:hypothetical protein
MHRSLRTWRLTPSTDSDLWSQSSYRGEVWVRAYDSVEARKLAAQRFRVRPRSSDQRRARMESPWYVRELTRCEVENNPRFDYIEMPCVVCPAADGATVSEAISATAESQVIAQERTDAVDKGTFAHVERISHDAVASDLRRAIVALLVARKIDTPGRWLDVYAAAAANDTPAYSILPAPKLKRVIAEELATVLDRALDEQETSWTLYDEDINKLLGSGEQPVRAA